jgi:hypothetical protein
MKKLVIFFMLALIFSCEKEQCWICDVERSTIVVIGRNVYHKWEYSKQDVFCGTLPVSDRTPYNLEDWDPSARRYTNCIPY